MDATSELQSMDCLTGEVSELVTDLVTNIENEEHQGDLDEGEGELGTEGESSGSAVHMKKDELSVFIENPLQYFDNLFDQCNGDVRTVKSMAMKKSQELFTDASAIERVPLLNSFKKGHTINEKLIRFRCMIQDTFDPEYYLAKYHVKDLKTGQIKAKTGMHHDMITLQETEEILEDHPDDKLDERRELYCVSTPGESPWVKLADERRGLKRKSDGKFENPNEEFDSIKGTTKRHDPELAEALNFPYPDDTSNKACFAKIYDDYYALCTVNSVVEIIGIVSTDKIRPYDIDEESDTGMTQRFRKKLEGRVPRIHVISVKKLCHINPGLSQNGLQGTTSTSMLYRGILKEILDIFTHCCFGDKLAAEYIFMALISDMVNDNPNISLKISINLTGFPQSTGSPKFFDFLAYVIKSLVTKSVLFEMSLDFLNTKRLIPEKNVEVDRLQSGLLQLSEQTVLLINETCLTPGELNETGKRNVAALFSLLDRQKVSYKFPFSIIDFQTNLPVLVYSENASILKQTVTVPIKTLDNEIDFESNKEVIEGILQNQQLAKRLRDGISFIRFQAFRRSDAMNATIESDYVRFRSMDRPVAGFANPEDLSRLLSLARLYCLTHGIEDLGVDEWDAVVKLEKERFHRLNT